MSEGDGRLENRYFHAVYHKQSGRLEVELCGLTRREGERLTVISAEDTGDRETPRGAAVETALRCKGVVIERRGEGKLFLYNDPFCTIPVYFCENEEILSVSSSPQRLIDYGRASLDAAGFWESVLFGTGIWMRTPFQGLRQLPAACRLLLGRGAVVTRYWSFRNEATGAVCSRDEREWLAGLDALMQEKFAPLKGRQVVMGLSGGMDSRLAALYLALAGADPADVHFFTFAASPASYEYLYAKEVAQELGFRPPELFLLEDRHYREALDYLPYWTAGQIGNNHGHIAQYLRYRAPRLAKDAVHLSTYYSDALLGWECSGEVGKLDVASSILYQKALRHPWLPPAIREQVLDDLSSSLKYALETKGFSSVVEFRYMTERNAKFHLSLAFAQSQFMRTSTAFADYDLLSYVLEVPLSLRKRKRIIDELINFKHPRLSMIGNSSSREYFYGEHNLMFRRGLKGKFDYLRFRALNMMNDCAVHLTGGRSGLTNPFQTEEQVAVFRRLFSSRMREALELRPIAELIARSRLDARQLVRPRLRDTIISEKYQLLNLAEAIAGAAAAGRERR